MLQDCDMPDVNGTLNHQKSSVIDGESPSSKRKRSESVSNNLETSVQLHRQQHDKDFKSVRFLDRSLDVLQVLQRCAIPYPMIIPIAVILRNIRSSRQKRSKS